MMNMLELRQGGEDMSEQQNRETLERLLQAFVQQDFDDLDDLLHEDVVEQYPQPGERIRGLQNYQSYVENIPKMPNVIDYSIKLSGDPTIAGGPWSTMATACITPPYARCRMERSKGYTVFCGTIRSAGVAGTVDQKNVTARKPTCGRPSVTPGLRIESKRKRSPCPGWRERKTNA
jgi:hypothetical protein